MTMLTYAETARRFSYHQPQNQQTVTRHHDIRVGCAQLAGLIDELCPDSQEKVVALTRIEEAMFWANAAVAREGK